jgi:hypothetical protein
MAASSQGNATAGKRMILMKKKVAIIQSNYIPWKGYFDIINEVDLFIFHDDLQYTKQDWRNRNKVKTEHGTKWLTVPVGRQSTDRLICEVMISDRNWGRKHWRIIKQLYQKAPFFKMYESIFEDIYTQKTWLYLSELNQYMIKYISTNILKIKTVFDDSRNYSPKGSKTERLIHILTKAGATSYLSGPAAKNYLDEALFKEADIELIYKNYSGYPAYPQFHPPFIHEVTILDLLFHVGPEAPYYIWGWRSKSAYK